MTATISSPWLEGKTDAELAAHRAELVAGREISAHLVETIAAAYGRTIADNCQARRDADSDTLRIAAIDEITTARATSADTAGAIVTIPQGAKGSAGEFERVERDGLTLGIIWESQHQPGSYCWKFARPVDDSAWCVAYDTEFHGPESYGTAINTFFQFAEAK